MRGVLTGRRVFCLCVQEFKYVSGVQLYLLKPPR